MRTSTSLFLAILLALATSAPHAAPAPWWQWRSKLDGKLACSQTPLGHGWEKLAGPYRDPQCAKVFRQPKIMS